MLLPIDDIICVYEHTEQFAGNWKTLTCLDKNYSKKGECPLCMANKNPGFKAYIPIIDRGDDNKVKILKASKDMLKQIMGLEDEYGTITNRDYKITRSGKGLQTKYQFFPKEVSKKEEDLSVYEIPDIESRIEPLTREAMLTMMNGAIIEEEDYGEALVEEPLPETKGKKYPF